MIQHRGLWYPAGDVLTKALRARLEREPFYRADRFHEAMGYVRAWRGAIDCGAWVGHWSRELAKRFERVVAIELHPETCEALRRNVGPGVRVVNAGLGQDVRVARIAAGKGSIGSQVTEGAEHEVEIGPLDELREGRIEHVDYLKVHVNGYELEVLKGATETLRRHRPVLTVVLKPALADYGAKPEDVIEFLARQGYRLAGGQKPYRIFVPGD